jgi:hypothetical protein
MNYKLEAGKPSFSIFLEVATNQLLLRILSSPNRLYVPVADLCTFYKKKQKIQQRANFFLRK